MSSIFSDITEMSDIDMTVLDDPEVMKLVYSIINFDQSDRLGELVDKQVVDGVEQPPKLTEEVMLDDHDVSNLLMYAIRKGAYKCVEKLIDKPYSWSVESYDYESALIDSANIRCYITLSFLADNLQGLLEQLGNQAHKFKAFHLLIWPQISAYWFIQKEIVDQGSLLRDKLCQEYVKSFKRDCGHSVGLMFELQMAHDDLLCFSTWNIQEGFWPLNATLSDAKHFDWCFSYPHCLTGLYSDVEGEEDDLVGMANRWKGHRFGSENGKCHVPSLKSMCRAKLRVCLADCLCESCLYVNNKCFF